jgi:ABC-type dipeptide/oligopeptide/nickel transport system permease subunit
VASAFSCSPKRRIVADQARQLPDSRSCISRAWWLGVFSGLFIMITVLSINFLGDALRDLLDVREAKDLAHG